MSKIIPLFAVTLAFAAAACGQNERLPAAPTKLTPQASIEPRPSTASTASNIQARRPAAPSPSAPPVSYIAPQRRPTVTKAAPVRQVVEAPRIALQQSLPQSRQTIASTPIPLTLASAEPAPRPYSPIPATPIQKPAPVQVAALSTPIPAARSMSLPRTNLGRPPARTELERLNPGMPRLVGPAPASEVVNARPRAKPNRANPRAHGGAHTGFSIPNTTTPATYATSLSTPPTIEYQIPHIPQEEPLWCWAAAAQQAIGWVNDGKAPAQCAIVAMAHGIGVDECCNDREGVCARTGEIPAIAALVRQFGGQAAETATVPRNPKEVYDILQSGATLLIRIRPAPHDAAVGIRHMIVVRGIEWLRLPNGQLEATLFYNDPLGAGYRAVSFTEIEGFFEQALIVRRST